MNRLLSTSSARLLRACGLLMVCAAHAVAQPGPAPVAVASVVKRDVAMGKPFVGTVVPLRVSTVGSAVDGRVVEFPVNEGDRVVKGQLLCQLLTATLEIELAAAKAELDVRRQELAELENGSRPEEIEERKAAMLAAQARRDYAVKDFERVRRLYEQNTAADDEMDEASSRADETRQEYLEAKAAYDLAVEGPRKERIAQARARVQMQQEAVNRIADQIAKHSITTPFDGYVVAEHTEIGEWLAEAAPVAEVVELDVVEVRAMVVENDVSRLRIGAGARVEVDALPADTFTGIVSRIVPQADTRSRSFPVHVRVENPSEAGITKLKAGMFARVTLPVGAVAAATLVPKDSLVLGGPSPVVFVVEPVSGGPGPGASTSTAGSQTVTTARPVAVELGVASGGLIQIRGAVEPGEKVVVRGNERLVPGQAVLITEIIETPDADAGQPAHGGGVR